MVCLNDDNAQRKIMGFDDNLYDVIRETDRLHKSITDKINTTIRNFATVPSKATIRFEYVKCGKINCNTCIEKDYHGGYYFAYWRDKENHGKLKKKYIGVHDPRSQYVKEFADCFNK